MNLRQSAALVAAILMMMSVTVTQMPTVHGECFDKIGSDLPGGTITIGNSILDVHVEDQLTGYGIGTYTVTTGSAHPSPGRNVFFTYPEGAPFPYSTYTTLHVTDTQRDYVTAGEWLSYWVTPDSGYTLVNLDTQNPSTTSTSTMMTNTWTTTEQLQIVQEIEIIGTTTTDTLVRIEMCVTNNDAVEHTVGIRNEWDLMIDGWDGAWIRPWISPSTPGTWLDTETEWTSPTFLFWETSNMPESLFSVYGSISSPGGSTPPDRFVFAHWGNASQRAYSYTPTGIVIGGVGPNIGGQYDSSVLYYWNPTTINSGESKQVVSYVTTFITAISPISATVDLDPDKLNLMSNGQWITVYTTLPEGYSVGDIDATTVELRHDDFVLPAEWGEIQDGVLMTKFDRIALRDYLGEADLSDGDKFYDVTLTIAGELSDGTPFEGTDIIAVIRR